MRTASKRASRPHKRAATDYTLEEMINTSGFDGMLSFLENIPPDAAAARSGISEADPSGGVSAAPSSNSEALVEDLLIAPSISDGPQFSPPPPVTTTPYDPFSDSTVLGAPALGDSNSGGPVSDPGVHRPQSRVTPVLGAPDLGGPVLRGPFSDGPITSDNVLRDSFLGSPDIESPVEYAAYLITRERRPRPWKNIDDALTHGERAVYKAIYSRGKPYGTGEARAVVTGVRQIADWAGLAVSNTHPSLRTLVEKGVLEIRSAPAHNMGKFVIASSYTEIARRWRTAGLTHVLKQSRGVRLVKESPVEGEDSFSIIGSPKTGPPIPETRSPETGKTGSPETAPNIRKGRFSRETTTATEAPEAVVNALLAAGGTDDDAALRITIACRQKVPDATDKEIAHFILSTTERLRGNRRIENLIGLLITQVPRCFQGASFRLYRAAEERRIAAEREAWQAIINDPQSSAPEREMAREALIALTF